MVAASFLPLTNLRLFLRPLLAADQVYWFVQLSLQWLTWNYCLFLWSKGWCQTTIIFFFKNLTLHSGLEVQTNWTEIGLIKLNLCSIRLLDEPFVNTKLGSIIKRYILVQTRLNSVNVRELAHIRINSLVWSGFMRACVCLYIYKLYGTLFIK